MSSQVADPAAEEVQVTPDDQGKNQEVEAFVSKSKPQNIPLSQIRKSEVALRDVNRQTEQFQLLFNSIKQRGIMNSIVVREQRDPTTGVVTYGLVDGLQRFTCATDLGFTEIPANVVELDDAELLEAQIITNLNRVQTKPAELSKHLLRILSRNPMMTKQSLAERCCQSLTWVNQRLSLDKLTEEIQELVNEGRIHLSNAYALAKIPEEEQAEHVDAAISESPKTFVPRMKARVKEIRDAKNAGKDATKAEFKPTQHLQKVADVKEELASMTVGKALIAKHKPKTPEEAWELCVKWMLHADDDSVAEQKRKADQRKADREEAKKKLAAEREEQKQKKAAEAAASLEKW